MLPLGTPFQFDLTFEEAMTLRAALRRHVAYWIEHAAEDGYATHSEQDVELIRRKAGQLIWRLEDLTTRPEANIVHSSYAAEPDDD